jgi:hypothetical protein
MLLDVGEKAIGWNRTVWRMQLKEFQGRVTLLLTFVFLFEKTYIFENFKAYSLKDTNTGISYDIRFGEKDIF